MPPRRSALDTRGAGLEARRALRIRHPPPLTSILTETNRHAGHADILREQLDGTVGTDPQNPASPEYDVAYRENRCAKIEQAAKAADRADA